MAAQRVSAEPSASCDGKHTGLSGRIEVVAVPRTERGVLPACSTTNTCGHLHSSGTSGSIVRALSVWIFRAALLIERLTGCMFVCVIHTSEHRYALTRR